MVSHLNQHGIRVPDTHPDSIRPTRTHRNRSTAPVRGCFTRSRNGPPCPPVLPEAESQPPGNGGRLFGEIKWRISPTTAPIGARRYKTLLKLDLSASLFKLCLEFVGLIARQA